MSQGRMSQGMMSQGMMSQGMMSQGMIGQGMMSQGMMSQGMAVSHHLPNLQAEFGHPAANYPAHYGARVDAHPQQHRLMAVWHQHLVCLCHHSLGKAKDLVGMTRASVAHLCSTLMLLHHDDCCQVCTRTGIKVP